MEHKRKIKIIWVAGARPNFVKIAPIWKAMLDYNSSVDAGRPMFEPILVHTGQHYDVNMSDVFFKDLELPKPHYYLGVGSGTHAEQTAKVMIEFEKVLGKECPDMVGVVGDVNSTLACALATVKSYALPGGKNPLLIHVEAGLRSGNKLMPEEINRIVTDAISDILFTTEESGNKNLVREGIPKEKIYFVGNVMIDSLFQILEKTDVNKVLRRFEVKALNFGLVSLHRPSNVDRPKRLKELMKTLDDIGRDVPLLFPVHPRTRKRLEMIGWKTTNGVTKSKWHGIRTLSPLSYKDFVALMSKAAFVITDSGGIQEETTALGIPCLTLRETTERPVTVEIGTNKLLGNTLETLRKEVKDILAGKSKKGKIPPLWDGNAAKRIVKILAEIGDDR